MDDGMGFIAFIVWTLVVATITIALYFTFVFPRSPDPGYGYKWSCEGDKVVVKYANDDEGSYLAGQLCERVKK